MGDIWLSDLPVVVAAAGLDVECWPGWETRCRGSGGYTHVWAVFAHHTASSTSPHNDCSYMWDSTSGDQPIGAILLDRTGKVWVGAAGATNCQGKGGPYPTSHGTIPTDSGNSHGIAVEAANNGVGEPWPIAQQTAYVTLCKALCEAYGMDPTRDIAAHFEWTSRKIDPAGPSDYATGSDSWDMDMFRADCDACDLTTNGDGDDEVTDADMKRIADLVWQRPMTFTPTGTTVDAETMLEYAAAYACLAQQQTTDER